MFTIVELYYILLNFSSLIIVLAFIVIAKYIDSMSSK